MLETIYIGMSGLLGYSRGLRVIANNTANMNTPGFKSSSLQFADMFYTGGNLRGGISSQGQQQVGFGLDTLGTVLSFRQGELRHTSNDLDMAVDGQGLFVLRDAEGTVTYTRDGQFQFDTDGFLVSRTTGARVMALDSQGEFTEITLANLATHPGKPTSRIGFSGNLSSTSTEQTLSNLKVTDSSGRTRTLSLRLQNLGSADGGWSATLLEGTSELGGGRIAFRDGKPLAGNSSFDVVYAPENGSPQTITFDFGTNVTSFAAGNLSTLAVASQDAVAPSAMTGAAFDGNGVLTVQYASGAVATGAQLALARFDSPDAAATVGSNQFQIANARGWHLGAAGEGAFGKVKSGTVEISNVDLSQEFSDLVVMQRGYQASSQVISTANDMLQELFSMKSK